jgi:K+-transporting ATPase KdpF subunit
MLRELLSRGRKGAVATSPRLGEILMDYVIAGLASAGLFVYLIYALLRPEKF